MVSRRGQPPTRGKAGKAKPDPYAMTEAAPVTRPGGEVPGEADDLPVAVGDTSRGSDFGGRGIVETSGEAVGQDEEQAPVGTDDGVMVAALTASGASLARARRSAPTIDDLIQELWGIYEQSVGGWTHRWPERDGTMRETDKPDPKAALMALDRLAAVSGLTGPRPAGDDKVDPTVTQMRVLDAIVAHPEMRAEVERRLMLLGKKS